MAAELGYYQTSNGKHGDSLALNGLVCLPKKAKQMLYDLFQFDIN